MKQLKAIIFDVDGTLAETERDGHRLAFNQAFSDAGFNWYWDENLYGKLLAVAGGKERIRHFLSTLNSRAEYDGDLDSLIAWLHAEKTKHYIALLQAKTITLRPGVARLINDIGKAGLRLAIATTTTSENVTALIKNTLGEQVLSWFDCIAAGDLVPTKKPAPDIFDYCIQQLGLSSDECVVIEDSANGVLAAQEANITTIVTLNNYTRNDNFAGAITVLDHLGEPDLACSVITGRAIKGGYLTVDDIRNLHGHEALKQDQA